VSTPTDARSAWQAALAAEYAAAFGYGTLGPRLTDAAQAQLARTCESAHRDVAATTAEQLVTAGATPVQPEADYQLPFAVTDADSARQLALRLETAAASAWRFVISIADTPATLRATALAALSASAVRAVRWRALVTPATPTVPFPGI
jgi:hypothetical protein